MKELDEKLTLLGELQDKRFYLQEKIEALELEIDSIRLEAEHEEMWALQTQDMSYKEPLLFKTKVIQNGYGPGWYTLLVDDFPELQSSSGKLGYSLFETKESAKEKLKEVYGWHKDRFDTLTKQVEDILNGT